MAKKVAGVVKLQLNAGKATPMIIVMPDGNTGKRGYFNDIKGEWRYEDFFFQEFLPSSKKLTG